MARIFFFFWLPISYAFAAQGNCLAGQQCYGAAGASMLQTQTLEFQVARSRSNYSLKQASIDVDAIKVMIEAGLAEILKQFSDFQNSELMKKVLESRSNPLVEFGNYTLEKAQEFWDQIKVVLQNPKKWIKEMLEKWVPGLKQIMENINDQLKQAQIERFFNGEAFKKLGMGDIMNIFSVASSFDGEPKMGYERYFDALMFISKEANVGQLLGQILDGAMKLLKDIQDAVMALVDMGLSKADQIVQSIDLTGVRRAIETFIGWIGADAKEFFDLWDSGWWQSLLDQWIQAKEDVGEWWANLGIIDAIKYGWMTLQLPAKAAIVILGWNSLSVLFNCDECQANGGLSLGQLMNQSSNESNGSMYASCEEWYEKTVLNAADTDPAVKFGIDKEAVKLQAAIDEVDKEVDQWSLADASSLKPGWLNPFHANYWAKSSSYR